jgi:hypothetical protein
VLGRRLEDATGRLHREHHARAAIEAQLRNIFGRPVVREALTQREGYGGGAWQEAVDGAEVLGLGDGDGSETAMRVFKALEDRIGRDSAALDAGAGMYRPPRHPTRCDPSFLDFNRTL